MYAYMGEIPKQTDTRNLATLSLYEWREAIIAKYTFDSIWLNCLLCLSLFIVELPLFCWSAAGIDRKQVRMKGKYTGKDKEKER